MTDIGIDKSAVDREIASLQKCEDDPRCYYDFSDTRAMLDRLRTALTASLAREAAAFELAAVKVDGYANVWNDRDINGSSISVIARDVRRSTPADAHAALQAMIDAAVKEAREKDAELIGALHGAADIGRVGVLEVEPLVWVESEKSSEYLTADTGFGIIYRISACRGPDNVMWWLGNTAKGENCADIPAAKAAAQEDYKARKLAKTGGEL